MFDDSPRGESKDIFKYRQGCYTAQVTEPIITKELLRLAVSLWYLLVLAEWFNLFIAVTSASMTWRI